MNRAPVLGTTINKLLRNLDSTPTGRRQSAAWWRAWYFAQQAAEAHKEHDYTTARHLLREADLSWKEV
jgi:hypothetical protein